MANGTDNGNGSGDGINWGALIPGALDLIKTGIGAASASTTECGRICRDKCRQETGWLFSGRQECKKKCKTACIQLANERASEKPSPYPMMILSIIIILAILGIVYWIFKKSR